MYNIVRELRAPGADSTYGKASEVLALIIAQRSRSVHPGIEPETFECQYITTKLLLFIIATPRC